MTAIDLTFGERSPDWLFALDALRAGRLDEAVAGVRAALTEFPEWAARSREIGASLRMR